MVHHFVDIRIRVDAENIFEALGKVEMIEEYIMNDDNAIDHFVKAVGISTSKYEMIGYEYEFWYVKDIRNHIFDIDNNFVRFDTNYCYHYQRYVVVGQLGFT